MINPGVLKPKNPIESPLKLSVFDRLTIKKSSSTQDETSNSQSSIKKRTQLQHSSQPPSTPKPSSKNEKQLQKVSLPPGTYKFLLVPVQYAQNGLNVEIRGENPGHSCSVKMDYVEYDVMVEEIQHHFAMPVMTVEIRFIKLVIPESWSPQVAVELSRGKGKLRRANIVTDLVGLEVCEKEVVTVNPFKDIDEAEIRRKRMLMKGHSSPRSRKVDFKTEITLCQSSTNQPLLSEKKHLGSTQLPSQIETAMTVDAKNILSKKKSFKETVQKLLSKELKLKMDTCETIEGTAQLLSPTKSKRPVKCVIEEREQPYFKGSMVNEGWTSPKQL